MKYWKMGNEIITFGNPDSSQSLIISANSTALREMYSGLKLVSTAFKT